MIEFIIPVIIGVDEFIKKKGLNIPKRYLPVINVVIGVGYGAFLSYRDGTELMQSIITGALAGLSASGLFDLGKGVIKKDNPVTELPTCFHTNDMDNMESRDVESEG